MTVEHEEIPFDVLFVGGGPASLAGAIRLMQLARENQMELEVALIEKGAEIGAHAVSGAILNPIALEELTTVEDQNVVIDEILVRKGDPVDEILKQSQKRNCDLIVMGAHDHGVIEETIAGSTARKLLRRSTKPVLVVRLPDE